MKTNEFDSEIKYKLYRSVKEILHPTISKKNISDYKIIIDESILPVRVFYPIKMSDMKKVLIFIHGNGEVTECTGKYTDICKLFVKKTGSMLIAIEYEELKQNYKKMYEEIYNTLDFIYKGLIRNGINEKDISLIGDSTGCNIITGINYLNKNIPIKKEILFYPTLSLEYNDKSSYESVIINKEFNFDLPNKLNKYFNYISTKKDLSNELLNPLKVELNEYPATLLIVGKVDCVRDETFIYKDKLSENSKYIELPFCSHGFLKKMDKDIEKELFKEVNDFL